MAYIDIPATSGIYKITNIVNGKVYVGSTVNLYHRRCHHFGRLRSNDHANEHLQNAFNKYGEQSFHFAVIELCDRDNLLDREDFWINGLNAHHSKSGYNILKSAHRIDSDAAKHLLDPVVRAKAVATRIANGSHAGEKGSLAKLTNFQVNQIRKLYSLGHSSVQISKVFGVDKSNILFIVNGKTWTSVPFDDVDVSDIEVPSRKTNKGSEVWVAALSEDDVVQIHDRLRAGESNTKIANDFKISRSAVYHIKCGNTWKHLDLPEIAVKHLRVLTEDDIQSAIRMRSEGLTYAQIGDAIGVRRERISKELKCRPNRSTGNEPDFQAA